MRAQGGPKKPPKLVPFLICKDFLRTITYIECQELKGISIVRGINI